jgi:hypothetical protein
MDNVKARHGEYTVMGRPESDHPERSLHPTEPALRFLSELLDEYGDEWVNKLMFHYRWGYPADQRRRSNSLASGIIARRSSAITKKRSNILLKHFRYLGKNSKQPMAMNHSTVFWKRQAARHT